MCRGFLSGVALHCVKRTSSVIVFAPTVLIMCSAVCRTNMTRRRDGIVAVVVGCGARGERGLVGAGEEREAVRHMEFHRPPAWCCWSVRWIHLHTLSHSCHPSDI